LQYASVLTHTRASVSLALHPSPPRRSSDLETLTTKLRLTAQRLLGHQRVRTGRTCVHLVVNQVVQLQVVHVAHGGGALELLARADRKSTRLNSSHVKMSYAVFCLKYNRDDT